MDFGINRIKKPAGHEFRREWMLQSRPVVLTDLFQGDRLHEIVIAEAAMDAWGDAEIPIDDKYDEAIGIPQVRAEMLRRCLSGRAVVAHKETAETESATISINNYFRFLKENPCSPKARVAFEAPALLRSCFSIPDLCKPAPTDSSEFDIFCFIGARQSFSQLHFDKDGTHGFVYQIVGRKRFILIPPPSAHKLGPLTQFGFWLIHNFADEDRLAFLEFTGGQETIIGPGDCLYIPAFWWHFADYFDDCWTLNLRFCRRNTVTTLVNAVFPDLYSQGIGHKLATATSENDYSDIVSLISEADEATYTDGISKVRHMRDLARKFYHELYPDARPNYTYDFEKFFPSPLSHFLDASNARRPRYR